MASSNQDVLGGGRLPGNAHVSPQPVYAVEIAAEHVHVKLWKDFFSSTKERVSLLPMAVSERYNCAFIQ